MGDQRVLRAIAVLGSIRHIGHFAALVRRLLEMLQIVEADAI
jgi:hypothetical protein